MDPLDIPGLLLSHIGCSPHLHPSFISLSFIFLNVMIFMQIAILVLFFLKCFCSGSVAPCPPLQLASSLRSDVDGSLFGSPIPRKLKHFKNWFHLLSILEMFHRVKLLNGNETATESVCNGRPLQAR